MAEQIEKKYTNEMLKEMQSWDLDRKIATSLTRIIEFANHFNNQVYVSFSGGKDSTVLLDLVRKVVPDIPAVFVDTGLEFPELRQFVKNTQNVITLRPEISFRKVIEKYGYPIISKAVSHNVSIAKRNPEGLVKQNIFNPRKTGQYAMYKWSFLLSEAAPPVSDQCCNVMKKKPLHDFEKNTGLKPFMGTMACESKIRKDKWIKNGCNAFDLKRPTSQPLSFWTEQDILAYIIKNNLNYASVYGDILQNNKGHYYTTGATRTGCMYCLFGVHLEKEPNRLQQLKETHKNIYDYIMKPWGEKGLGIKDTIDWINDNSWLDIKY